MTRTRLSTLILARLEAESIPVYNSEMPEGWDYWGAGIQGGVGEIPTACRFLAYIIPGDSEGHYFHIDALHIMEPRSGEVENLVLGKYFGAGGPADPFRVLEVVTRALDWTKPQTCILED
jgi:hypothetical protein